MPLFMIEFGYTPDAWARLVENPENREETVRGILEKVGCKLHGLWYAFGENDGFVLIDAPDNVTAGGLAIAISSSGSFSKFETHPLVTQEEMLEALGKAREIAYVAPGGGGRA